MISFAQRPTRVLVNLDHIGNNVAVFRRHVGPQTAIMAVVKADAYGHGGAPVARAALDHGAQWLGVALAEEGAELREQGIEAPILILGQSHPEQVPMALGHRLEMTVFDQETLRHVAQTAGRLGCVARVHLKVDTGMGRVGLQAQDFDESWWTLLTQTPAIAWQGVFTHLAESDADDPSFTRQQLSRWLDVVERIRQRGREVPWLHMANSAAALRFPGTHMQMVRVGIGLYGLPPYPAASALLQPALSWISEVAYVKTVAAGFAVGYGRTYHTPAPMQLVAVPVGYADGYRRGWSNQAEVLIRGRRYPVVGRVSMDQMTVAVPTTDPVAVGDRVTLIGRDGDAVVTADELADLIGTIAYEVVTGISRRVPRFYIPLN